MRKLTALALGLGTGLVAATGASAQDPVLAGKASAQAPGAEDGVALMGSLPFTGLDLVLIVGGGLLLMTVVLVFRLGRRGRAE
jgi:hypothetical protein